MSTASEADQLAGNRVVTTGGVVEGTREPGSGVRVFRGIPFAAPPVGDLRFAPPRPARPWSGIRRADRFGPRPLQLPVFGDMSFRSDGMGEDCLSLNVWTPAASADERLPVLVYLYGGGNMAGDGSEPRYDGEALARRGIVVLTANYRLGVFGFFAQPELSAESPRGGSGNQGYLDQVAALGWVRDNVAAFGGDPARVTIAGESAGSISVSILMASPLARGLFAGAVGSSGAAIGEGHLAPTPLAEKERAGAAFAAGAGARSLAELRAMPADALLEATAGMTFPDFLATVDGDLLPMSVEEVFAAGEQARVPLLVGWNTEEASSEGVLGDREPTVAGYEAAVRERYGEHAAEVLRLYPAGTDEEAIAAATDLAGDRFIGHGTWRWADLHGATGRVPVYRYLYAHPRPPMVPEMGDAVAGYAGGIVRGPGARGAPARGAVHSADIEYALGNLATNRVFAWTAEDAAVSEVMQACYVNFVTTGDPNGEGLPPWPAANADADALREVAVMRWDVASAAEPERHRERYLLLDRMLRSR